MQLDIHAISCGSLLKWEYEWPLAGQHKSHVFDTSYTKIDPDSLMLVIDQPIRVVFKDLYEEVYYTIPVLYRGMLLYVDWTSVTKKYLRAV